MTPNQPPEPAKPFIAPVFLPYAGCKNRCVFCDQKALTGHGGAPVPPPDAVRQQIDSFLTHRKDPARPTEIAFYGGTFLGLPPDTAENLLSLAGDYVERGLASGIRLSTRPDTVSDQTISLLARHPVTTVEIGVQSLDDAVLKAARRGHTREQALAAIRALKNAEITTGAHMMLGLPGDTPEKALATARALAASGIDLVRIHPTLVVKGSALAGLHEQGRYAPLSLEEAVDLSARCAAVFRDHNVAIARMGLFDSPSLDEPGALIAGPRHPAFGHLVLSRLFFNETRKLLNESPPRSSSLTLRVHPQNISRAQGHQRQNIATLKKQFHLQQIHITPDNTLGPWEIRKD